MLITEIRREKKHLMRLFFDGGEPEVLLDRDTCELRCLKAGTCLDDETLCELKCESDYARAKSRALWYLDRLAYSEKALYEKLTKAGFDKQASAAVIARFVELGLIDDGRFAENFANNCNERNVSRRETVFKMQQKGISRDAAEQAVDAQGFDEEKQIRALIAKKYALKLTDSESTQKVYAALVRKGFSFSAVRNVLKKYSEELEYSEE